jgi:metal-sulfur cluster biosynthetic enzyme
MNAVADRASPRAPEPAVDPVLAANPHLADDPLLAEIWRRVQAVEDPCHALAGYGLSIVDLGIVNRVEFDDGYVEVGLTYTELGCSFAPRILQRLEQELMGIDGVTSMDVIYEPFPPWTPDRMTDRARELYAHRATQARAAVAAVSPESIRPRTAAPKA